ncbi:MAG: hypothetical protein Q9182_005994 [Xanthomendoza sp. 2 TL-2023]
MNNQMSVDPREDTKMYENMDVDLSETGSELSNAPTASPPEGTASQAWNARQAKLDADILRLADPDATDDEMSSEVDMTESDDSAGPSGEASTKVVMADSADNASKEVAPQAPTGFPEEYAELIRTGYNLRRRAAAEESPYLASWQIEKERKRRERLEAASKIKEDMEGLGGNLSTPAPLPPAGRSPTQLTEMPPDSSIQAVLNRANDQNQVGFDRLLQAMILREQNDIPCTSPNCPVTHLHGEGLYLYEGEVPNSGLANAYFAPSIPPPAVVEAFNKINGLPSWGDLDTKDRFYEYHTVACRPSKHLGKVGKRQCKSQDCGVEEPHKTGLYLHDDHDASLFMQRHTNHIFGISNPPPKVWDAALRVKDGNGTERDHELVHDFSAHHSRWGKDHVVSWDGGSIDTKRFKAFQKEWQSQRP